jgi:glycosyltransferase involved in cell wall biosynthesis
VQTVFAAAFDRDVQPRLALTRRQRWWPLYAWGLASSDRIAVQHGGQLSTLPERWRAKACIVPSMAPPVEAAKAHRDRPGHVAWVAMLRQPKRPDILIEVARRCAATRFVVCGGPTRHRSPVGYGERIIAALRDLPNVDYLGQVDQARSRQAIAEAGVLLSTSEEEGFPNTFLEAWSSGTPVVSLGVDPDGHIRRHGLGHVSRDIAGLADDIQSLMAAPGRRDEIAIRSRDHLARAHSPAVVVTAFERALCDWRQLRVSTPDVAAGQGGDR